MISDEAVEAAFSRMPYQAADYIDTDTMREILEAAAPYLKAEAWDEGYTAGVREEQPGWTPNPYRSQA